MKNVKAFAEYITESKVAVTEDIASKVTMEAMSTMEKEVDGVLSKKPSAKVMDDHFKRACEKFGVSFSGYKDFCKRKKDYLDAEEYMPESNTYAATWEDVRNYIVDTTTFPSKEFDKLGLKGKIDFGTDVGGIIHKLWPDFNTDELLSDLGLHKKPEPIHELKKVSAGAIGKPKGEVIQSKDSMRVEDIVKKSGGEWNMSAANLTKRMALAITDASKAIRRGAAAIEAGYYEMARIFFVRAGQLGASV